MEPTTTSGGARTHRLALILLLLLSADRVLESFLLATAWKASGLPYLWEVVGIVVGYLAMSAAFYIERKNLRALNVDRAFLIIFILIGGMYAVSLPVLAGFALGLATVLNLGVMLLGRFQVEESRPNLRWVWRLALLFFAPLVCVMVLRGTYPNVGGVNGIVTAIYAANPYFVIFEEVIYRGLLWMLLRACNLTDTAIVLLQALLFWIVHFNIATTDPLTFWLLLPWVSLVLGAVIARSKSIAVTSGLHFAYNLLISLSA